MKTAKILTAAIALLASVGFTSCNSDDDDPQEAVVLTFATLNAISEDGTSFTVITDAKGTAVHYTCPQRINEKDVQPGQRLLVSYKMPQNVQPEAGGQVQLLAYQPVINGTMEWKSYDDIKHMLTYTQQCRSMFITGAYLNLDMIGIYKNKPKSYNIYGDESTKDSKMPTLYLVWDTDDATIATFKNIYASINVGEVWNNPAYDGFYLKYSDNAEGGPKTIEFHSKETIKPVD